MVDVPVLGLAGRQFGRWKNAGTFSRPTSKVFVGSGLEVGPRAPCSKMKLTYQQDKQTPN